MITEKNSQRILSILTANGGHAFYVGGAVRNYLLHIPVVDYDIATSHTPQKVKEILEGQGIKVIPTGIDFGTVTAHISGQNYEITTFRADIAPDGRHTKVVYTDDIKIDASRRDFTVNALYMAADGEIFDFFDGMKDISTQTIRFIGSAEERIKEDYLRILRMFRFHAYYGQNFGAGDIIQTQITACKKNRDGLNQISGERIRSEMLKIFSVKSCVYALQKMLEAKLVEILFKTEKLNIDTLENYINFIFEQNEDKQVAPDINPLSALFCVVSDAENTNEVIMNIAERWRLSKKERTYLLNLYSSVLGNVNNKLHLNSVFRFYGVEFGQDVIAIAYAMGKISDKIAKNLSEKYRDFTCPPFPVDGNEIKALGVVSGRKIGEILYYLQDIWESDDYSHSKEQLIAFAIDYIEK